MINKLEEIEAARSVIAGVPHNIDAKKWPELRALYFSEVETDYTSLFGGSPQKQSADALIAGWRSVLKNVTTQHLLGPIDVRVDGPKAEARCHVRALHYAKGAPGGEVWEVLGHYVFELSRTDSNWAIVRMKLDTQYQSGNSKLLVEANR